jgi:hypothetical protein
MQMAGAAAAGMGLPEIAVLNDPELILDPERAVLPVMPSDQIALEMQKIELDNMRAAAGNVEGTMPTKTPVMPTDQKMIPTNKKQPDMMNA